MSTQNYQMLALLVGLGALIPSRDVGESRMRKPQKPYPQNTQEQRDWNAALDAKRKAKKAKK